MNLTSTRFAPGGIRVRMPRWPSRNGWPAWFLISLALASAARPDSHAADSGPDRFLVREPARVEYELAEQAGVAKAAAGAGPAKLRLRRSGSKSERDTIESLSRVVLQIDAGSSLEALLAGGALERARALQDNTYILQAPDAWTALNEAQRLAEQPGVRISCPVIRQRMVRHRLYASKPNDPLFREQWHLENRAGDGQRAGADLNVRAAWPHARGRGVLIAVADEGVELDHPDLAEPGAGEPHYNFLADEPSGDPPTADADHGTAVAGLAVAREGNRLGVAGVAPEARLASWVVLGDFGLSDEGIMNMYQFSSDVVAVQNHSWGIVNNAQTPIRFLENFGLSNAVVQGRSGRGVVIVRSAGNGKGGANNANDYGHANDPRVIAVGAVRFDGRATTYSERGACVLVVAPSADATLDFPTIMTTDRLGSLGYNQNQYTNDLANYAFGTNGFSGTSASAPQISGVVALLLEANPALSIRDVQQILIHSARHFDLADHLLATNGAGFRVSHNIGFGVPDAGEAVRLARGWVPRPPLDQFSVGATNRQPIPDDNLVQFSAPLLSADLAFPTAMPSLGPEADAPSTFLPLVDVGLATNAITQDLTGKAAFILRGTNFFRDKIEKAAAAGAEFAVIYNHSGGADLVVMAATDFTPIPALFIGQNDGEQLLPWVQTNGAIRAQLRQGATAARYSLVVTQTFLCEHVALRVQTDHSRRGDLRITLVSPAGTRSILQHRNLDENGGPFDWTYYSVQHFYESSAGTWTVLVSDQHKGRSGSVLSLELKVLGIPIDDSDADGLDDRWERQYFGSLGFGPRDDPDKDGYQNAREQILNTDPATGGGSLALDIARLNEQQFRLSWPAGPERSYEVEGSSAAAGSFTVLTNIIGAFPEAEWVGALTNQFRFFRIGEASGSGP